MKHYGTMSNAGGRLMMGTQDIGHIWQERCQGTPRGGDILEALMLLPAMDKVKSIDDLERKKNQDFRVFVSETSDKSQVFHILESRATKVITLLPADPLAALCCDRELDRPGFTAFMGDLATLFDFSGSRILLNGDDKSFRYSGVAPAYSYLGLQKFVLVKGDLINIGPCPQASSRTVISRLTDHCSKMSTSEYVSLQTAFYQCALEIKPSKLVLPASSPVMQLGKAKVEGEPFFKAFPKLEDKNSQLYRSGHWPVTVQPPKTVSEALARLQTSRSWRGEDAGKYSSFTRGHRDGGDFSKDRIQTNRALSLLLPLLREDQVVEFRSCSDEIAKKVQKFLENPKKIQKWEIKGRLKHIMPKEHASASLGKAWKHIYVEVRTPGVMLVDLHSAPLPSFEKGTNIEEVWGDQFKEFLPLKPFIARRKVPPSAIPQEKNYVFKWGSSHAFDFLVSSSEKVDVAAREVVFEHGKLTKRMLIEPLNRMRTDTAALMEQFKDDRRKLTLYLEMEKPAILDRALNIWTPPKEHSKKKRTELMIQLGLEDDDAQSVEDFEGEGSDEEAQPGVPPPVGVQNLIDFNG